MPPPPAGPPLGAPAMGGPDDKAGLLPGSSKPKAKKNSSLVAHLSPRAIVQVFLTLLTLGTSVVGFTYSIVFREYLVISLVENYDGDLKSEVLPCVRSTLDVCANHKDDQCWDRCCPPQYTCSRHPMVGLYCQDGNNVCGGGDPQKEEWCMQFADISKTCRTQVCIQKDMIFRMTGPAMGLAALAVLFDVIDAVLFIAAPDVVVCKSGLNLMSSMMKWMAFGIIIGGGTQEFMGQLYAARCFNGSGMNTVALTVNYLISFLVSQAISALLSLVLSPISAYYGGKLIGVPYVK